MTQRALVGSGLALLLILAAVMTPPTNIESFPRQELIQAIQRFETSTLGFPVRTRNFQSYDPDMRSYDICWATGKLELPDSQFDEGFYWAEAAGDGCPFDESKYDVYFYAAEGVAGIGGTTATTSLLNAPMERFLYVVIHEDCHEQFSLPWAFEESVCQVIGLAGAKAFAEMQPKETSLARERLSGEPESGLEFARVINRYHAIVQTLYRKAKSGKISEQAALRKKEAIFAELQQECRCSVPLNNAVLASLVTYTRYYPLIWELYAAHGRDLKRTVQSLIFVSETQPFFRPYGKDSEIVPQLAAFIKSITRATRQRAP